MLTAAMLMATPTHAAPLSPVSLPLPGADVALAFGSERSWLRDGACTTGVCDAVRAQAFKSVEVKVRMFPWLGAYGRVAKVSDDVSGADYEGGGYALAGGAIASVPIGLGGGLHGWAEVGRQRTESSDEDDLGSAEQWWHGEVGAAVHGGDPRDGLSAWAGVAAVPWTDDQFHVLGNTLALRLRPNVPVEATGGLLFVSEPLGGPWSDRNRLSAAIRGTAGYRLGITGALGWVF